VSLLISDAVIWQETAEGVSLYHSETGAFLTLNETAAQIWILLAHDGDRESVITKLSLLFGGGSPMVGNRIRADVDEFISSLTSTGLLAEGVPA